MAAGAIKGGKSISGNVGASSNTNGSTVLDRCVALFTRQVAEVNELRRGEPMCASLVHVGFHSVRTERSKRDDTATHNEPTVCDTLSHGPVVC